MSYLSSPGVLVREFDITNNIPAVSTSPGGFAGVFQWGPVDQLVLTDSEETLVNRFWKPANFNGETWFTCASFLAYTNKLWISRAADTTGNTQTKTFSGNSTNLAAQASNSFFKTTNNAGLAVGQVLIYANAAGIPVGAKVASVNSTGVILNASATANVQSSELVFRDDVTYSAAALQSDLNYDVSDVTDWDSLVVKNEDDYTSRTASFDAAALYVARYPGEPGNSLRVCVCDTASQFKSNTAIAANAQINATASVLTGAVGSNTLTVTVAPVDTANATDVTAANVAAGALHASLSVGDLVEVGNTRIGFQYLQITSIANVAIASNVFTFTVTADDKVKLASNTSNENLNRYWEHYNTVDIAPGQSDYVLAYGNTAANDEMHIVVIDEGGKFSGSPGTVLEVYSNLSRASDAKSNEGASVYYKTVINNQSKYLWWANDRTTAVSNTAQYVTSSTATKPLSMEMVGGSSGLGESDVPLGTLALAWDKFKSSEDIDVSLLMQGKARGEAISNKTQLANYIIDNVAEQRSPAKDCVVFISPDYDDVINNKGEEIYDVVNFRNDLRVTSYGFLDSGYKYMYDKYNDVNRWIPLNGDMAGLAARTDYTNDPWWSFAGLTRGQIRNVTRLSWNPRSAQRDVLYKSSVNPVISTPGEGTYLNGDKTLLDKPSAFDRINVRRLFIVLEKAIARASKFTLFEFNDDFTRAQFRNMVIPYLRDVKGRRGIYDFNVKCDAQNNTPEVIDRNEFIGTIFIKPAKSINYITLNFVAVRTGVSFETVAGFGG